MRKLDFVGTVQAISLGIVIPGRDALIVKPADWPKQLPPGILSIEVRSFPAGFEDQEDIEMEKKHDIQEAASDLLLVEQAREWLLEEQ